VEGNSTDVKVEVLSKLEKSIGSIERSSELGRESADGLGVVGDDSEYETGLGVRGGDFGEFVGVIEGHEGDVLRFGELEMGLHLAWIGEDDSGGVDSRPKDLLNLRTTGAIEVHTKASEELNNSVVGVALDSVEGLNAGKVGSPLVVLAGNGSKISDVESFVLDNGLRNLVLDKVLDA